MNNDINYSSLPTQTATPSVWKAFRLSFSLLLLLIIVVGMPYYIGEIKQNSNLLNFVDDLTAYLEGLAILIVVFIGYHILTTKLREQRAAMQLFAQQNNWTFEGRSGIADPDALPEGWGFLGKSAHQIYRIQGNLYGKQFELYAIWGITRTRFTTRYGSTTLSYRTALRTKDQLNTSTISDNLQITRDGKWNYVVRTGNAITAVEINAMLQLLK